MYFQQFFFGLFSLYFILHLTDSSYELIHLSYVYMVRLAQVVGQGFCSIQLSAWAGRCELAGKCD